MNTLRSTALALQVYPLARTWCALSMKQGNLVDHTPEASTSAFARIQSPEVGT